MKIIGISTRTTNENGQAMQDLGALWGRFFAENISARIKNTVSADIFSIYTDYESNYQGEYTAIIGVEVESLADIPEGMVGREFPEQTFKKFVARGEMPQAVTQMWKDIWEQDTELSRSYLYDYERYTEKSQQGDRSEVEIYIGVK